MLSQLLEDASDTLAVERALAGAVRLAALPLPERAASARPLLKRARKQALDDFQGPFSGHAIRADLGWLALTWGTGELPPPSTAEHQGWDPEGRNPPWPKRRPQILSGLLSARIGEACTLIAAGRVGQLRAEPQFADGTISPAELDDRRARWAAARLPPCRYDLEIARLRAAPANGEALALEPVVTASQVKYRRTPWGEKLPYTDDRPAVLARLATAPKSAAAPYSWRRLTDLEHSRDDRQYAVRHTGVRLDEMVAAWSLLCPHDPELAAAHLLTPLSDGLQPGRTAAVTALRGLAGLPGTFGPVGHLALVTGLSGAAAEGRIAAADAWGQLDRAGRLDPVLAAAAVKLGVNGGALKLIRIAVGLGYAAADPASAVTVTQTCLAATAALLPGRPAGLHLLLELAARSGAGSLAVPPAVAALAAGKGGGKLAGAAWRLTRLG